MWPELAAAVSGGTKATDVGLCSRDTVNRAGECTGYAGHRLSGAPSQRAMRVLTERNTFLKTFEKSLPHFGTSALISHARHV